MTIYLFFEMMTLVSMPLVLHTQSHEAVMAGLKYLFYSMCGAYMALFGVFVFYHFGTSMDFLPGGVMDPAVLAQNGTILHLGPVSYTHLDVYKRQDLRRLIFVLI